MKLLVEKYLLPICTNLLTKQEPCDVDMVDMSAKEWDRLCEYASVHGLLSVLSSYLQILNLQDAKSREVIIQWYGQAQQQTLQTQYMQAAAERLSRLMQLKGLDVMFLKGICLAQYYPLAEMRQSADIDYYLYGHQKEGLGALEEVGIRNEDVEDYHAHATMDGVRLEMHQSFIDTDRLDTNLIVENALRELAETEGKQYRCDWLHESVTNAYRMSPTMNAIFLMRHMAIHFVSEAVSLRMLYDWGLFLMNESNNVDWEKVCGLYEQVGMTDFAQMIQRIVVDKLNMPVKECCPIESLANDTSEKAWQYILNKTEGRDLTGNPLKVGLLRRYRMLKDKWKYDIAYPKDSYWKMFFYMAVRGIKTINRKRNETIYRQSA